MTDPERFEAGLKMRKRVVGAEYVERAMAGANDFTRPMQELVTEYCWGEVWNRDGLTLRERSLLNIGMLTALGQPEELKLHARGALNNGASVEELREVLLQAAIYCGVPAALAAMRAVGSALGEAAVPLGDEGDDEGAR